MKSLSQIIDDKSQVNEYMRPSEVDKLIDTALDNFYTEDDYSGLGETLVNHWGTGKGLMRNLSEMIWGMNEELIRMGADDDIVKPLRQMERTLRSMWK
jgi:hypothetical protein